MCACQGQPSGRGWGRRSSHLPDGRLQHGARRTCMFTPWQ
eukprot:jgi/Astpho2/5163/gw1.00074.167.1_t